MFYEGLILENKQSTKKNICYYMLWRSNGLDLVYIFHINSTQLNFT